MSGPGFVVSTGEPTRDVEQMRRVLEAMDLEPDDVAAAVDAESTEEPEVRVYRFLQGNAREFLETVDADDFARGAEELLQERFGPGKYEVNVRRRGASAARRHVRSKTYNIGTRTSTSAAAAQQLGGAGGSRLEALLERVLSERAAPAPAPGFFEAVAQVAKAQQESTAALLVPLLTAVTQQKAGASPDKMVEMLLEGMKLGREQTGGGEGFGATMRELLPGFLTAAQQLAGGGARAAAGAPAPLALPPGQPQHGAPDVQQNGTAVAPPADAPAWVVILAPYVPQLLQLAAFHASPEHWAGDVVEHVDGERLTFIEDQLARGPIFREEFFRYFPTTIDRRSWFEQFFDALTLELQQLREDEPAD